MPSPGCISPRKCQHSYKVLNLNTRYQTFMFEVYAANILLKYFVAAQDGGNHFPKSPIQIDWLGFKQAICESDENENLMIQRIFDQILAQWFTFGASGLWLSI